VAYDAGTRFQPQRRQAIERAAAGRDETYIQRTLKTSVSSVASVRVFFLPLLSHAGSSPR
jgi:hypothetical protein